MFEPTNEQGTIIFFTTKCLEHGYKLISIGTRFPDAVIEDSNGKRYRTEFEYKSSNFKAHKHDPSGCDLIVCWENNYPGSPLPVLELCSWQPKIETDALLGVPSQTPTLPKQPISQAEKQARALRGLYWSLDWVMNKYPDLNIQVINIGEGITAIVIPDTYFENGEIKLIPK